MKRVNPPTNKLRAAFCEEYLIDKKQTAAAIRAGYAEKGAAQSAATAMKDVEVKAYIEYRLQQMARRANITAERVLEEYAKIAFVDPREFYAEDGSLVPVPELDEDVAAVLTGIEVSTTSNEAPGGKKGGAMSKTVTTKIKMSDKKAALDSIARHLGMFVDKSETKHSGVVNLTVSHSDAEL